MNLILIIVLCFLSLSASLRVNAEEGHDDSASSSVGPEKGITEKGPEGFKLSHEAITTMGLQTVDVSSQPITLPSQALVKMKNEKFIFRLRNGWYKRVAFQVLRTDQNTLTVSSSDISAGDKVVTAGLGFLRIAEVFSEEGAEHSHAH